MVNSNYTGRKLIDDLDGKDVLKVLWDPANNCWCHETAFPDGYNGVVSFESVYHPGNGNFEAGFRMNIEKFKSLYG